MARTLKPVHALCAAGALAAGVSMPAAADYGAWATVVSTRPVYTQVATPQQQCFNDRVVDTDYYRLDQVPLGARGHVIERGGGNDLVAVPRERLVQRCETVNNLEQRIEGYEVRYIYDGREYTTRLPYDPGSRLRVNVDVRTEAR
jgi:uncharacterized protein YcfJ